MADHYNPTGFALEIFQNRYSLHDKESFQEACDRVANHVASAEVGNDVPKYKDKFAELLKLNHFMPGGRIWYGSGRPKGQLLNCFVIDTQDSREGWGKTINDEIIICGLGGGLGVNFSPIRPRGMPISGQKGTATGAVSLMEIVDAAGAVIKAGGGRRTALMFALDISHGDILEFLDKKLDLKQLNNANVSVWLGENPEELFENVKKNREIELKFGDKVVGKLGAKLIWDKIVQNALKGGEPGLLNGYLMNKMSNISYYKPIICTNPCITGDTLIATADGRNAVPISQLAKEGKDVPLYSVHPGTGHVEIKLGVNPRITGYKKEIWKLTLDDGSVVRATPNHKFILKDLSEKRLDELKPGDSLLLDSKWKSSWKEFVGDKCNSNSQDYWLVGNKKKHFEHTLIAQFNIKRKLSPGEVVHHKDSCGLNNNINNLEVMSKIEHDKHHAQEMMGEKNPYHSMTDEWKIKFATHVGEENGMYGKSNKWGHHSEETKEHLRQINLGKKHTEETKQLLSQLVKERTEHFEKTCNYCGTPFIVTESKRERMYCSHECAMTFMNKRKNFIDRKNKQREEKAEIRREIWIKLYSEFKFQLKREPLKAEFEEFLKKNNMPFRFHSGTFKTLEDLKEATKSYNHKVLSVEFSGYEDVYNITVEDNHNFGICLPVEDQTKTGKTKYNWIFTRQCGEIGLCADDCCCLGALVLPRFVKNGTMDWNLLKESVQLSHRFLDNVLTVNNYPLPSIKDMCHNIRRVGLGVMGLHDMLLMMGLKYSSPSGLEMVDKVMGFIKNAAYENSIELAKEKGSFPAFEADKFLKGGFAKTLKPSIRNAIKEHGIRNCASLTIAPTGTTSIVCDVSSGVEPMFAAAHVRKYRKGDEIKKEVVVHPLFKKFVDEGKGVKHFQGAYDLKLRDHFEMQKTCQRHLDNACSKTINLMPGTSAEELSELYMEYLPDLKGVTVYPEGSREDQPLTPISLEEAILAAKGDERLLQSYSQDSCKSGVCDI